MGRHRRFGLVARHGGEDAADHNHLPFEGVPHWRFHHHFGLDARGHQPSHHLLERGVCELRHHAFRDDRTNALQRHHLLHTGLGKLFEGPQALGQQLGHRFPHMANAQRKQHALKRNRLARSQTVQQVVHRLLGHALQRQQLIRRQGVQVRHISKEAGVHQLRHGLFPKPIHVHGLS